MDAFQIRVVLLLFGLSTAVHGAEPANRLTLESNGSELHLRLRRAPMPPVAGTTYKLTVQSSGDLQTWSDRGLLQAPDPIAPSLSLVDSSPHQFFRVQSELEDTGTDRDGADLFGY